MVKKLQLLVVFNAALFPLFPKIVVVDWLMAQPSS